MCTVAIAHRLYAGAPIVLVANRDEQLSRPSTPPADHGEIFAPRDEVALGTWLGVNKRGVLAAITNRFGHAKDPTRRSRGLIVRDALACSSAREAMERLGAIDPRTVSPFHLLVADTVDLVLVFHDGDAIIARALPPGWTVLTERSLAGDVPAREARVHAALSAHVERPKHTESRKIMSVHSTSTAAEDRLAATCVHLDELGYGTRSSSYVSLGEAPAWLHGEGPPCTTEPVDHSAQLARFLAR